MSLIPASPALRLIVAFLYFLPSVIALARRAPHFATGFLVNLLLGWTVVGWMYSMAWGAFAEGTGASQGEVRIIPKPVSGQATAAPDLPRAA